MTAEKAKELSETQELQEAPASASVKIKSTNGFEYIFTLRDLKASNLMFKIEAMETKWLGLGWTPVAQQSGFRANPGVQAAPTKMCTVHQVPMTEKISKTSGKHYFSHSEGVYPNNQMCFGQGFSTKQPLPQTGEQYPERQIEDF